jgi:alanyl-tRNA synthetase
MGLERTAAVVQGKTSVYETDLFTPLLEGVSELAGKRYGSNEAVDNAMRVIAEHSRGITFLIADGVIPSNEGRGYVLRRVLRRAALFGRRLGLDKPFIGEMARAAIEQMGHVYPELVQRQDFILQVTELEEARFSATLSTGLELLDRIVDEAASKGGNRISGEQAFKLYDTYGFPVELTTEVAAEHGFSVDSEGFEEEMERQRERAREGQKLELFLSDRISISDEIVVAKHFVGYDNLKHKSKILDLVVDNKSTGTIKQGQEASLILESTPFYAEMGGQVGDAGEIHSPSGKFLVTNTIRIPPDIIVHQGKVVEGSLAVGDEVEAEVDRERRLDIARNHTATHLLQFALRQVLGEHVQQRGSLVAPDRLRFDFSHLTGLTREEIDKVNQIVNDRVRYNLRVYAEDVPYKKAIDEGAIALFDEKYGDKVRVVKIGEPATSAELCGGTHVASTGEIGLFHIIAESSIGAGLRRIEAVTGRGAEKYIDERLSDLQQIAQFLGASPEEAKDRVSGLIAELEEERRQVLTLERELAKKIAESLLTQAEVINGVTVLVARVPSLPMPSLRDMSDFLRDRLKSAVVVLGTVYEEKPAFLAAVTPDLVDKGYNAGEIVKQVAKVTGGSGGGKPSLGQAGGKDKGKLDEALKLVKSLI